MLTLRRLEIFVRVAQSGHVTAAGRELGLTQAAVSMALAQLEQLHGGPLFERQGRRLVLNEKGRLVLPRARDVIERAAQLREMLDSSWDEPVGVLHVGASTTIGNYVLPALMGEFSRRYPQAEVQLQVANTEEVCRALVRGDLDVGLIEGPCHHLELECTPWRNDELLVICAPGHPWTQRKVVEREDLLTETWIMREPGSGTREVFCSAMDMEAAGLSQRLELGHTEAIKNAVQAGLGVSCLSRLALETELELGRVVEIQTSLNLQRQLSVVICRRREHGVLTRKCLEMLQSE